MTQSEKEKAAKDFAVEFHIEYGNREAEDEVIAEAIYLLERGFLAGWNERDKHPPDVLVPEKAWKKSAWKKGGSRK